MKKFYSNSSYYRIHHIRPRFKNDVESVLFFIASSICRIGADETKSFNQKLNQSIRFYPGNMGRADKTINNWRTEISALFGLIITENNISKPSPLAIKLYESGNITNFFKSFLFNFQYPGGHLKPHEVVKLIDKGIKFKPAKLILDLLVFATKVQNGKHFGISKIELTHLVFNNLFVTRNQVTNEYIFEQLIHHRQMKETFDSSGDVIRYAGDILDYLELADLVYKKLDGKYYPKMHNKNIIDLFIEDVRYFKHYENLYKRTNLTISEVNALSHEWQNYASTPITFNNQFEETSLIFDPFKEAQSSEPIIPVEPLKRDKLETNKPNIDKTDQSFNKAVVAYLKELLIENPSKKEIGDIGETITIQHEKNRLKNIGLEDLIHQINKIPDHFGVGYDIQSIMGIPEKKHHKKLIEVKSTISKNKLSTFTFHLSETQWRAAESFNDSYFVYRIFISSQSIELFVIRDPVSQYKNNKLKMNILNGAQITFDENSGNWEKILV